MRKSSRIVAVVAIAAFSASSAGATPVDTRDGAVSGANRLVSLQNADGSFPWDVTDPTAYQNVQGVTAIGVLDAYLLTRDAAYLTSATKNRDWLLAYRNSGTSPPQLLSAPNATFLARYAAIAHSPSDLQVARDVLSQQINTRFGSAQNLVTTIVDVRKNSHGLGNMGLWDVALYVTAAQSAGMTDEASAIAAALDAQTIADPFDGTANYYELGLTGLITGLATADAEAHATKISQATAALLAAQQADGSIPTTYGGVLYPGDAQATAYGVLSLIQVGERDAAQAGASFLLAAQRDDGGFEPYPDDPTEYAEIDAEAVDALTAATLVTHEGRSLLDVIFGLLPI